MNICAVSSSYIAKNVYSELMSKIKDMKSEIAQDKKKIKEIECINY
jgi:hypothetical protein